MKVFYCKICKRFSGTRRDVRHHLRWDHFIKSSKKIKMEDKHKSQITPRMGVIETFI